MTTADEKMQQEFERIYRVHPAHEPLNFANFETGWHASAAQSAERIKELEQQVAERNTWLAECYRQSGADPDGNEDWRLASDTVAEVTRLRNESDDLEQQNEQLQARMAMLHNDFESTTNLCIKWYVSEREARFVFANESDRDKFSRLITGVDVLSGTQTAEEYKRRVQADALIECAEVWETIGYSKFKTPAAELRRMAAELKEGEQA